MGSCSLPPVKNVAKLCCVVIVDGNSLSQQNTSCEQQTNRLVDQQERTTCRLRPSFKGRRPRHRYAGQSPADWQPVSESSKRRPSGSLAPTGASQGFGAGHLKKRKIFRNSEYRKITYVKESMGNQWGGNQEASQIGKLWKDGVKNSLKTEG